MEDFPLTKKNRIQLAAAFRGVARVDLTLDCVIEGQMGTARVDSVACPGVFQVQLGPFLYFAGDAACSAAREAIRGIPAWTFIMPSSKGWLDAMLEIHGEKLLEFDRYSFAAETLSAEHLNSLLANSPVASGIRQMDTDFLVRCQDLPDFLDISAYESGEDFLDRGAGFYLMEGSNIAGTAYGSLVCSRGIEISLFVEETYRRRGIATALSARLLLWCLEHSMEPHWDAANPESCKLALKLGYHYTGSYLAYYLAG